MLFLMYSQEGGYSRAFTSFHYSKESIGAYIALNQSCILEGHCIVFSRSSFRVVHPLAIELPRSLGMVVTHWNLPMHLFLKNCELEKYAHISLMFPPDSKLHTNRDLVTLCLELSS